MKYMCMYMYMYACHSCDTSTQYIQCNVHTSTTWIILHARQFLISNNYSLHSMLINAIDASIYVHVHVLTQLLYCSKYMYMYMYKYMYFTLCGREGKDMSIS